MQSSRARARTYVEIALVALVVTFMMVIGAGVLMDIFWTADPKAPESFRGAFLGAFFAFLFVRLGESLKRIDDRRRVASRALVALEHRYNQLSIALSTNRHLLGVWDEVVNAANTNGPAALGRFVPVEMSAPTELLLDLTNIDLVTELFNLNQQLEGMGRDLRSFAANHDKLADAFVNDKIDRKTFDLNVIKDNRMRLELEVHIDLTVEKVEQAIAALLVLQQDQSLLSKFFKAITPAHYSSKFEAARSAALARYRADLVPLRATRKAEIQSAVTKATMKTSAEGGTAAPASDHS